MALSHSLVLFLFLLINEPDIRPQIIKFIYHSTQLTHTSSFEMFSTDCVDVLYQLMMLKKIIRHSEHICQWLSTPTHQINATFQTRLRRNVNVDGFVSGIQIMCLRFALEKSNQKFKETTAHFQRTFKKVHEKCISIFFPPKHIKMMINIAVFETWIARIVSLIYLYFANMGKTKAS